MSRVLKTGTNQITYTYAEHCDKVNKGKGWAKGVDIVKNYNQCDWITAHTDGTVIKVVDYLDGTNGVPDKEGMGYGNYVMIEHRDRLVTLYAHLEKVQVKEGQKVTKGTVLGFSGNTGSSFGAHLHFEIRLYKEIPQGNLHDTSKFEWIDPTSYLDKDLPTDAMPSPKAVGYLDVATWNNNTLTVSGWAYKGGGNQKVTIKVCNGNEVVASYTLTANKSRPDVKSVMKYSTDKVGFSELKSLKLADGTYTVKAYVGTDQLTNIKTITVENPLTAKSYPNYTKSDEFYRVRKSFNDSASSKGSFSIWANAFDTWNINKSSGYHIYDKNGTQLD